MKRCVDNIPDSYNRHGSGAAGLPPISGVPISEPCTVPPRQTPPRPMTPCTPVPVPSLEPCAVPTRPAPPRPMPPCPPRPMPPCPPCPPVPVPSPEPYPVDSRAKNVDVVGKGSVKVEKTEDILTKTFEVSIDPGVQQYVTVTATWRDRHGKYMPDMPYVEIRDFIKRGVMPVLHVVKDGKLVYSAEITSDDGSTATFRVPDSEMSSESRLPDGTTMRKSMTVTREFRYGSDGFSVRTTEVKPAVFSVESMAI